MKNAFPQPLTRTRHTALTVGTGVMAGLTAIFLIGAPPIPVAAGVILAVGWLMWHRPAA